MTVTPQVMLAQQVAAAVEVRAGRPFDAAALRDYCRTHLADVKCPRSIDFRPELPRHPTGKLYKRHLKDEYWEAAGRAI